ncbi:MAG: hypothetical protein NWQ09_09945 [Nonlabens sp.]|nr:hypothetical protein [Nonlabens sp.]
MRCSLFTAVLFTASFSFAQNETESDIIYDTSTVSIEDTYLVVSKADATTGLIKHERFTKIGKKPYVTGYVSEQNPKMRTGTWQWFYENGNVKKQITYSDGRVVGKINSYFSNGELRETYRQNRKRENEMPHDVTYYRTASGERGVEDGEGFYNGSYEGKFERYIDSLSGRYLDSNPEGTWKGYRNGVLVFEETYEKGIFISGIAYNNGKTTTYSELRTTASPTIPMDKYQRKLYKSVMFYYDRLEISNSDYLESLVLLFDVETDGSISNIRVQDGMGKAPNEAAIRGMLLMKEPWNPATIRGYPIKSTYGMKYTFETSRF